jgi:predicted permease
MFRRRRSQDDFAAEIQSHLELEADELADRGLSRPQAHTQARREFGSVVAAQESFYGKDRWSWLDALARNLRFALRALRHNPVFAATAILTLALGIGANTAVFSVMNAVLLRSLPVTDPQRLVYLHTSNTPQRTGTIDSHATFSYPVYDSLRRENTALSEVMAVAQLSGDMVNVRVDAQPEQAQGDMVSGNFFHGLGVNLARGRGFVPQDETDHALVIVLSYNYWTRRFARDPEILGKTVYVKGVPFSVIGVSAEGFEGTEAGRSLDFWIPLQNRIEFNVLGNAPEKGKLYQQNDTWWCLNLLGRLAPGVSRAQALGQLQSVFARAAYISLGGPLAGETPPLLSFADAKNFPGYDQQYGKPLRLLMAMVGLVLLIALTNVVMLLLARNASRQREFSLRLALGAQRGELLRQLLAESVLLVGAGGVLAWGFAGIATRTLATWARIESSLAPDSTVLFFTLGVLVLAVALFGLAPFRTAAAGGAQLALRTTAPVAEPKSIARGNLMIGTQIALCVVLLVGSGLLTRTLRNLQNIPLGMRTEGLLVFALNPQHVSAEPEAVRFYQELGRRLRVLPGVESVAVMRDRLGSGWSNNFDVTVDGRPPDTARGSAMVRNNEVGPNLFHTLGVPLLMGREFSDADTPATPPVAVVNELFVDRFLPGQNAVGHRVNGFVIVGVVKNHKFRSMDEEPIPMAWWAFGQNPDPEGGMNVVMRVKGDALAILPEVRKIVAGMDPDVPLLQPILQREQFEQTISRQLLFARLAEFFALLAIVLLATGLYGTLAYRVHMRTAEIGVRMAVGAQRAQVIWMILSQSLALTAAGVAAGLPLAILAGRALSSSLYGVQPLDPLSYLFAMIGLAVVALAASAVPAARAAAVDPLTALRVD